jgi:uncharacterized integral membrane protein
MTALLKNIWRFLLIAGRIVIFISLFVIAATNSQSVTFNWFPGLSAEVPLILLLLVTFLLGILIASIAFLARGKRDAK